MVNESKDPRVLAASTSGGRRADARARRAEHPRRARAGELRAHGGGGAPGAGREGCGCFWRLKTPTPTTSPPRASDRFARRFGSSRRRTSRCAWLNDRVVAEAREEATAEPAADGVGAENPPPKEKPKKVPKRRRRPTAREEPVPTARETRRSTPRTRDDGFRGWRGAGRRRAPAGEPARAKNDVDDARGGDRAEARRAAWNPKSATPPSPSINEASIPARGEAAPSPPRALARRRRV